MLIFFYLSQTSVNKFWFFSHSYLNLLMSIFNQLNVLFFLFTRIIKIHLYNWDALIDFGNHFFITVLVIACIKCLDDLIVKFFFK